MTHPTTAPSDVNRIRHAVGLLAPLWTSWTLETLHERGPQRSHQLRDAMPWLNAPTTHQVLLRMHNSGLVTKPERGSYAPSPLGESARPAHRALAAWHADHFEVGATSWKSAGRVEDALARLRGKGSIDVLTALDRNGPMRPGTLRETAGMASGSFHYRTQQLLDDGLITRLGPDEHFAYALTPAAEQLGPVYAKLHDVGSHDLPTGSTARANARSAQASRAQAARQHSPAAPAVTGLFSHPPEPQPRVPAHITALSHPSRTR